jgi:hypothetical protein
MKVDGQCLCGDLRYEADVDADTAHICHCTDCQTLSGSAFRVTVFVNDKSFRISSGKATTYIKVAASGRRRELGFCPRCGTSIYSRPADGEAGYFGLRVGSLRQRDVLVPKTQCWRRSAQRWTSSIGEIPAFDGD